MKVQKEKGKYKGIYNIKTLREIVSKDEIIRSTIHHYERFRKNESRKFPGLYFHYDQSPIIVEYKKNSSFLRFLVNLMALLGGIVSIGNLVDNIISGFTKPATNLIK